MDATKTQMVREALTALGIAAKHAEVVKWIHNAYRGTRFGTVVFKSSLTATTRKRMKKEIAHHTASELEKDIIELKHKIATPENFVIETPPPSGDYHAATPMDSVKPDHVVTGPAVSMRTGSVTAPRNPAELAVAVKTLIDEWGPAAVEDMVGVLCEWFRGE